MLFFAQLLRAILQCTFKAESCKFGNAQDPFRSTKSNAWFEKEIEKDTPVVRDYLVNIWSWLASKNSVKLLIGPSDISETCSFFDQMRFGPKTMARLNAVILFRSLLSITYTEKRKALNTVKFPSMAHNELRAIWNHQRKLRGPLSDS